MLAVYTRKFHILLPRRVLGQVAITHVLRFLGRVGGARRVVFAYGTVVAFGYSIHIGFCLG